MNSAQLKLTTFVHINEKYFPKVLKNTILKKIEDSQITESHANLIISNCKLHSPTVQLLLSIFLGHLGVDRFKIGSIGPGILKLICGLLSIVFSCATEMSSNENEIIAAGLLCLLLSLPWFIDIFFIKNKTRKINYRSIMSYLDNLVIYGTKEENTQNYKTEEFHSQGNSHESQNYENIQNNVFSENFSTIEIAKRMKAKGIPNSKIALFTGLSIHEIENL